MRHRLAERRAVAAVLLAVAALSAAACSSSTHTARVTTGTGKGPAQNMADMDMGDMAGMPTTPALAEAAPTSTGLAAS